MSEAADQINQIKANARKYVTTSMSGVIGGFIVNGQTQYQDTTTNGIVLSENSQGVAATTAQALQMQANYHETGNFDGTVANTGQASLFGGNSGTATI